MIHTGLMFDTRFAAMHGGFLFYIRHILKREFMPNVKILFFLKIICQTLASNHIVTVSLYHQTTQNKKFKHHDNARNLRDSGNDLTRRFHI